MIFDRGLFQFLDMMKQILSFLEYDFNFWGFRFSIMDSYIYCYMFCLCFDFIGKLFGNMIHYATD